MTVLQRSAADRLLAAKGQAITLTRRTPSVYDPATGTTAITSTTQAGKGVILPLSPMMKANASNIVAGDQQLLLSSIATSGSVLAVPHVDDTITLATGEVLALTAVDPLSPAGLDILYDCIVRRIQGAAVANTFRLQVESGTGSLLLENGTNYLLLESAA